MGVILAPTGDGRQTGADPGLGKEVGVSPSGGRVLVWFPPSRPGPPLQVRRRSKACRAGLKERDELLAIGPRSCADLSHADAMSLVDSEGATLSLRVKRSVSRDPPGFHPSPHPFPSHPAAIFYPAGMPSGITSPPDSEAYYGETDSDADTQALTHRRQRRTPPHARSTGRYDNQEEEETSEMSGWVPRGALKTTHQHKHSSESLSEGTRAPQRRG